MLWGVCRPVATMAEDEVVSSEVDLLWPRLLRTFVLTFVELSFGLALLCFFSFFLTPGVKDSLDLSLFLTTGEFNLVALSLGVVLGLISE